MDYLEDECADMLEQLLAELDAYKDVRARYEEPQRTSTTNGVTCTNQSNWCRGNEVKANKS